MSRQYPIKIGDYKHKTVCDINRCDERSSVSVGAEGMPAQFNHLYCHTHMKQIIVEGLRYYAEDKEFINAVIEGCKGTLKADDNEVDIDSIMKENEALKASIEAKEAEKEKLLDKIASKETTIENLEIKLKKAVTASSKAGGRR